MIYALRKHYLEIIKRYFKYNLRQVYSFKEHDSVLEILGEPRCGKTSIVLSAYENRKDVLYFSFAGLSERHALRLLRQKIKLFTGKAVKGDQWSDIFDSMKKFSQPLYTLFLLDDIDQVKDYEEFIPAFRSFIHDPNRDKIFIALIGEKGIRHELDAEGETFTLYNLSLYDVRQICPKMDEQNALLVSTVTGGIPELVQLFSEYDSFDTALPDILRIDSPLLQYVPNLMNRYFRKADIYNELLAVVADGNTRVSEIGFITGYPYNKCDKYLRTLVDAGILDHARKEYRFRNTHIQLYYSFLAKRKEQLARPSLFPDLSKEFCCTAEELSDTEFTKACFNHARENNYGVSFIHLIDKEIKFEPISVDIKGNPYYFDTVFSSRAKKIFIKIVHDPAVHFGINELEELEEASIAISPLYESMVLVYSRWRFSDYCERYSKNYDHIKFITYDRLKYRNW